MKFTFNNIEISEEERKQPVVTFFKFFTICFIIAFPIVLLSLSLVFYFILGLPFDWSVGWIEVSILIFSFVGIEMLLILIIEKLNKKKES